MNMKKLVLALVALAVLVPANAQRHIYGVKSGILKTVTDMSGHKSYNTLTWDNYGDKEKAVTTTDMGSEIGTWTATILNVGERSWGINQNGDAKESTGRPGINWLKLQDKDIKEMKIQKLGKETYKGRECIKYQYEQKQLMSKAKVTVWVWEGLVLKQLIEKKTSKAVIELESLKLNVSVPASTFAIPKTN